jgi:hypothetical protein
MVIGGGQTGADQAAWRAAKAAGITCGGWMPKGYLTEAGPRPEFADLYGAREHPRPGYPPRTGANVKDSDVLIWFGDRHSPGGKLTLRLCQEAVYIPRMVVSSADAVATDVTAWWIGRQMDDVHRPLNKVLMIAGNRESSAPGIGAWVEVYLAEVFRLLEGSTGGR